jgi:hypothetical protein
MTKRKKEDARPPMSLEELARRMFALPVKARDEMTRKKAKPRKRKCAASMLAQFIALLRQIAANDLTGHWIQLSFDFEEEPHG